MPILELDINEVSMKKYGIPFSDTVLGIILSQLPPLSPDGVWLAGGSLRDFVAGKHANCEMPHRKTYNVLGDDGDSVIHEFRNLLNSKDLDFFFSSKFRKVLWEHALEHVNAKHRECQKAVFPRARKITSNNCCILWHYELGSLKTGQDLGYKFHRYYFQEVQTIHITFPKSMEDLMAGFNWTLNQFAYDGQRLICTPHAPWDLMEQKLYLVKPCARPKSTVHSLSKYLSYGYRIDSEDLEELHSLARESKDEIWLS